ASFSATKLLSPAANEATTDGRAIPNRRPWQGGKQRPAKLRRLRSSAAIVEAKDLSAAQVSVSYESILSNRSRSQIKLARSTTRVRFRDRGRHERNECSKS
ncbi:MAG: hypothetical protein ACXU9D_19495, partial [Xanthobacteraceae bacterium]